MSFILSKPAVRVNNQGVAVKPNSVKISEGEGETDISTASLGGDEVEIVISDNAEDKIGTLSFALPATPKNADTARGWKKNPGVNVVDVSGETPDGEKFSRVFRKQSITNNYDVNFQSGGDIALDWGGERPS